MLQRNLSIGILVLGVLLSAVAAAYEEPAFTLVSTEDGIEYRRYQPHLVAETIVTGVADRDTAANIGFRRLFDYISGANEVRTELAMTAPVRQQPADAKSAKIDMTVPVRQTPDSTGWRIAFVVPREYDERNVPRPTDPNVTIRTVPGQLLAVLRFSGRWTDENVDAHRSELLGTLSSAGLTPQGPVITAFYNPPFSLPFVRRNEVMVAVNGTPADRSRL